MVEQSGDISVKQDQEEYLDSIHTEVIHENIEVETTAKKLKSYISEILQTLILAVLLYLAINGVTARIKVDGYSMEPTLHDGEFILVNKMAYLFSPVERGDVIVFHYPRNPEQEYIKRVIGLSGESVNVSGGVVKVDGNVLEEPYIAGKPTYQSSWAIPEDSLFVLGDNRNNSSDSHSWGPLPVENLIGKAVFVYWPPSEWGKIEHYSNENNIVERK